MLFAMCGYAGAQVSAQNAQPETSQNTQQTTPENVQLVSAQAQLSHALSTENAAQGQVVTAKLTSSVKTAEGMKMDKGTMLIGKVEKVERSNNNGPARLSIVFDQARLKDGKTIPVKATLLGAYPSNAGSYYAETGVSGNMIPNQPHMISSQEKIDQMPGTLSHVGMHSAVQSNVSATFIAKDRNVELKKGTRLQVAIAPLTANNGTAG